MKEHPVRLDVLFGWLVFLNIAFQKVALPTGEYIGVPLIVMWGILMYLFIRGVAVVDGSRASLFGFMMCGICLSLLLERRLDKGFNPLLLLMICYVPMLFRVDTDRETMLLCLNKFQTAMSFVACIVIGQQIMQFSVGSSYWPDYEKLVPKTFLVKGYMYIRPYDWDSGLLTPNGFFFLEPSGLSLYLALATVCEIIWLKRIGRFVLLAFATVAAMAGTGIVILVVLSPFLYRKLGRRPRYCIIGFGVPVLLIGIAAGAFSHLSERSGELSESNSSGHGRLIAPFEDTLKLGSDPSYWISGNGPGSSLKMGDLGLSDEAEVQWPSDKLIYEYGLMTAIFYYIFLIVLAYRGSPHPLLVSAMLIPHLFFGGGLVGSTGVLAIVMFCSLFRVKEGVPFQPQVSDPRIAFSGAVPR